MWYLGNIFPCGPITCLVLGNPTFSVTTWTSFYFLSLMWGNGRVPGDYPPPLGPDGGTETFIGNISKLILSKLGRSFILLDLSVG